jgi:hypothetical protein
LDLHALGLAAVAAELNLEIDALEPEVGRAVQKGAAALYLAGYGPRSALARHHNHRGNRQRKAGRIEAVLSEPGPAQLEPAVSIQSAK